MSYQEFEKRQGIEITDGQRFHERVCGACENKEICEAWEMQTMTTLYTNKNERTGKLLVNDSGKTEGIYRCAHYSRGE